MFKPRHDSLYFGALRKFENLYLFFICLDNSSKQMEAIVLPRVMEGKGVKRTAFCCCCCFN